MTIWEKVIVNIERGAHRVSAGAALFSERVRAEIALARLRIRRDEVRTAINEQYGVIGRTLVELMQKDRLPHTTEQLLKEEQIVTAVAEINSRERDLADIQIEIANEQTLFKPEKTKEETAA